MFMLDIETLDVESTAVILSASIVLLEENSTFDSLLSSCLFVKFDSKEQIQKYKRTISKDTLEWWSKQSDHAKSISLTPSLTDISAVAGIEAIRSYLSKDPSAKKIIWTRGSFDSMVLDSLCRALDIPVLIRYNQYMDLRTGINLLSKSPNNGYCEVNHPDFDIKKVQRHDPRHDICHDGMQLLYPI